MYLQRRIGSTSAATVVRYKEADEEECDEIGSVGEQQEDSEMIMLFRTLYLKREALLPATGCGVSHGKEMCSLTAAYADGNTGNGIWAHTISLFDFSVFFESDLPDQTRFDLPLHRRQTCREHETASSPLHLQHGGRAKHVHDCLRRGGSSCASRIHRAGACRYLQ